MSSDEPAITEDLGNLPRFAIYKGRRVRIIGYDRGSIKPFSILDRGDERRSATRSELTFVKPPRK